VPLKLARDRREEARQQLAAGIDPGAKRKAEKVAQGDTFEAIAREWLALQEPKLAPATFAKAVWTLETLIFPGLGKRPIAKISAPDLLTVLRKIEVRGTYETAHRAKQRCGQVFRYAIATGRAVRQAVELLRELQVLSRRSSYLFSALGNARRPMSENTVNAALRRLGYAQDEMTGQGFRSMASRSHRTAARPRRAQQGASRVQPGAALGRAAPDDAGMGGLLGSAPGWKDCDRVDARGGRVRVRCAWTAGSRPWLGSSNLRVRRQRRE